MLGFKSSKRFFAALALLSPREDVPYKTWRCRLDSSTRSSSITPNSPTPAAVRYCKTGQPSPPAPTTKTRALDIFS